MKLKRKPGFTLDEVVFGVAVVVIASLIFWSVMGLMALSYP